MEAKLSMETINNNLKQWGIQKDIIYNLIKYNGNKSEISYTCKKCGHIGTTKYYYIQQNYGCKKCGINKRAISRQKYSKEDCIKIANNYIYLKDFYTKEKNIYTKCVRNKWVEEVTKNLIKCNSLKKRCLYAIYFPNNTIYIGLTYNFSKRINQHLTSKGAVYEYIKDTNIHPIKIKQLTSYMNDDKIQIYEQKVINFFHWLGFTTLNRNKGGSLGQVLSHITKDECKEKLKLINFNLTIFRKKYQKYYNKCLKEQWLLDLIPNYQKTNKIELTKDECKKIALKYKTRTDFYRNETSIYNYAQRNNFLDYVLSSFTHLKAKKEIEQYSINGDYINTYKSISDAVKQLNIRSISGIIQCCQEKQFSSNGFQWKYKNSKKVIKKPTKNKQKKVYQINNKGKIINLYNSINEAQENTNIAASSISACCCKKRKRAGKFIWIYEKNYNNFNLNYYLSDENVSFIKTVYQYTLNGILINEYDNTSMASKQTSISRTAINNCINNRSKSAGGYIWRHELISC